jgi:membrane protease YdiL (CAAX protease family)
MKKYSVYAGLVITTLVTTMNLSSGEEIFFRGKFHTVLEQK